MQSVSPPLRDLRTCEYNARILWKEFTIISLEKPLCKKLCSSTTFFYCECIKRGFVNSINLFPLSFCNISLLWNIVESWGKCILCWSSSAHTLILMTLKGFRKRRLPWKRNVFFQWKDFYKKAFGAKTFIALILIMLILLISFHSTELNWTVHNYESDRKG